MPRLPRTDDAKRVCIKLSAEALARADKIADRLDMDRSALLQRLIEREPLPKKPNRKDPDDE